jgi:hypothetical protein
MVSNTTSFGLDSIPEIFRDPCQNKSHCCGILYTSYSIFHLINEEMFKIISEKQVLT